MSELGSRPVEQRISAEHFCTTKQKLAVTSMEWTISNFNLLKFDSELCLKSSSFESVQDGISTGTWYMKLVTNPMYANEGRIAIFLVHTGYNRCLFVGLDVWIVDADGKVANKKKICYELDSSEIGFHNFIQRSCLLDSHLPNGNLTLHCFVAVVPLDSIATMAGKPYEDDLPRRWCSNLLKVGVFSDAVLVCGDKSFHVHKCILSARSSVFREMFQQNVKGDIKIEDLDAFILKSLLSYIYSDNIEGKCTVSMAEKLLSAAKKYCLFELEDICEEFLEKNVAVHNFLEVASTADLHNLKSLKEVCINYMYAYGREIVLLWNFKEFFNTAPHYLINGVLAKILEGGEPLQGQHLPTTRPSLTSKTKPFVISSSAGLHDVKQQAIIKGTQSEQFAASIPPSLRNAIEQVVPKSCESLPKQTNFLFGLSTENHPVFSPNKKVHK